MKAFAKEHWGLLPSAICIPLLIIIIIIHTCTEYRLRNIPRMVFFYMCLISFGAVILWVCVKFIMWAVTKSKIWLKIAAAINALVSIAVFVAICYGVTSAYLFFLDTPEEVIVKHEIKMVAEKRDFLFSNVTVFYEYKNPLFYGKKLGYESAHDGEYETRSWYFYDPDGNLIDASEDYLETLERGGVYYGDRR